jgi:hypothetical protein
MINSIDFTIFALPMYVQHFSAFCGATFPAGSVSMVKSRASEISIFRATKKVPARFSPLPEIIFRPSCLHSPPITKGGLRGRGNVPQNFVPL